MRVAIVTFPGSNCDADAVHAFGAVLGAEVWTTWHTSDDLSRSGRAPDAVVIPGGFSYGDYLRCGALAAHSPVMGAVHAFADGGGPVIGICNGFQVLTEARLLPGQLVRNAELEFRCQDVHLRVERADLPFTRLARVGQVLRLPIAHAEGRYHADAETLTRLDGDGRVVFRYVDAAGERTAAANVNGSVDAIAGVVNERGNVLGMMPHPERAVEALLGDGLRDGLVVLGSILGA
ncbi:MAG: phosphoribosylformylglycinamidine synthase subunit PurQ [Trueperaceae bacterium]|nr:phosphoribosylformylglycinamidine synthase subunit PurQ [Trueperaceae bacterium]MCO5172954.1 phosphoribosylformylglycinamidine synthase subunit PurQ [Trueperaceae bacterium]MCW5820944.1 phosphoribosylformylglycinamidine synthase subunit PurQ [Trueperaceae bacterium]